MFVLRAGQVLPPRPLVDVLRAAHQAAQERRSREIAIRAESGAPLVSEATGATLEPLPPFDEARAQVLRDVTIMPRSLSASHARDLVRSYLDAAASGEARAFALACAALVVSGVERVAGLRTLDERGEEVPLDVVLVPGDGAASAIVDGCLADLLPELASAVIHLASLDPFARARCGVPPPQS